MNIAEAGFSLTHSLNNYKLNSGLTTKKNKNISKKGIKQLIKLASSRDEKYNWIILNGLFTKINIFNF